MGIQRDQVIATALSLLEKDGLEGLSMRKLAQALQIQAPSLYWHFDSKQALIDGMADALVQDVARDIASTQDWDATLRQVAGELRQALRAHRDGARVFAGTYVVTDNVMRTGEAMIGACVQAGADTALATTTAFSVLYYVLGLVMEEQALGPEGGIDIAARKAAFVTLAKEKYPQSLAARDVMFDTDFDARFATGLELLVAGLKSKLRGAG
ncbi:transcriptional regulator [Herbaspirillum sp. CF444]|uniref:TetR/AcrR family transcriptional regulator C-terminal domain-containing protein n=1 Tax=Herbaspirillum sp. CF444 TaxID=1144319 RepID=UPI0002727351|nr:TetR/AcrR family transcriptional regulator C-terminal domain-containing protein [Herbaspirillum sp. CF444]EJL93459.1 transcriptional regulator [Herbaspirillum sp. CF444]